MSTDNNLISSVLPLMLATIASFSILGITVFLEEDVGEIQSPSFQLETVKSPEGYSLSEEGLIATSSSPNYYYSQEVLSRDNPHSQVVDTKYVELTGYSSTIDQTNHQPFITASGARVEDGVVATNILEFGTKITIPEHFGDKVFVVKDRMAKEYTKPDNSSYDGYIDIWFPSRQAAEKFGRVRSRVNIIE